MHTPPVVDSIVHARNTILEVCFSGRAIEMQNTKSVAMQDATCDAVVACLSSTEKRSAAVVTESTQRSAPTIPTPTLIVRLLDELSTLFPNFVVYRKRLGCDPRMRVGWGFKK